MSSVGETLGNYKVEKTIGRGRMAEVYLATHRDKGYPVAIKVVHSHLMSDKSFLNRFEREAQVLTQLEHPHIVYVYEYKASREIAYLVMEYLQAGTLGDKLKAYTGQGEKFPMSEALQIMEPVASAVDYAHEHDLVHSDLKPANILFRDNGDPVLTDFGLAFLLDHPHLNASKTITGTPAYLSPEQAEGQPGDARSDIYTLGIILYELLTGYPPFQGNHISVVMKHISETPPSLRTLGCYVPKQVEDVIMKALEKEPHQRYQSAQVLLRSLREAFEKTIPEELPKEEVGAKAVAETVEASAEAEPILETETELAPAQAEVAAFATPLVSGEVLAAREQAAEAPARATRRGSTPAGTGGATARPAPVRRKKAKTNWLTVLAVVGVLAIVIACVGAITLFIQNNDVAAAGTPKFAPGQRVVISIPGQEGTSVYNGCPPWGVHGIATDGQIARIQGRRICNNEWYYDVVIPQAATDDWDGSGTVLGKFLK